MSEIFNFAPGPVEETLAPTMLTHLQVFNAHRNASLGVLTPAGTVPRSMSLTGDSMLVSSKHSAMLCPSIPHRSTRLKPRILSKGQFIVLTTSATPGTLAPVSFTHTSLKGLGQQEEARFPSSTELGMTSPAHSSIRLLSRLHASLTPSGSSVPK